MVGVLRPALKQWLTGRFPKKYNYEQFKIKKTDKYSSIECCFKQLLKGRSQKSKK